MKKGQTYSHAETRSSRRESSWQTKPLEEVCSVEYGTRVVQKRDGGKGFPVYGGGGATFEMDGFNREDRLVVARFGMSEECTRFVAGKFFLNDSGLTVSPKNGAMHQRFLDYQMLALSDDIYALGKGTAQKNLDVPVFRTLQLFVPESLAEQQRIVGLLDEAFEGLATAKANAENNLQNARALFESHLQSVFTQRGPGWVEKPLAELCDRITKGSSPKWQGISYVGAPGILFVTSENVGEYEILLDQPKYVEEKFNAKDKKSILRNGDVLTNIVGASIGRTAVFDRDDVANINQAVCLIRCEPYLLNNYYLTYLLNSPVFKQVLHDNEVNNARANLSLGFFSQLPVPMPPIPKQKEIVAKLDAFREETQRLARLYERKQAALEALKKSLLHQAFTGEL